MKFEITNENLCTLRDYINTTIEMWDDGINCVWDMDRLVALRDTKVTSNAEGNMLVMDLNLAQILLLKEIVADAIETFMDCEDPTLVGHMMLLKRDLNAASWKLQKRTIGAALKETIEKLA